MYHTLSVITLVLIGCDPCVHGFATLENMLALSLSLSIELPPYAAAKKACNRFSSNEQQLAKNVIRSRCWPARIFGSANPSLLSFILRLTELLEL